jgi:hypothetical protein
MSASPDSADWAREAREERAFFDSLSIPELHDLISSRQFGRTNAIFYSLLERSTLSVSAWPLLEVLERRSVNRTFRYHAANVLLRLMDSHEWSAEQLSDDHDPEFDTRMRDFRREAMNRARA